MPPTTKTTNLKKITKTTDIAGQRSRMLADLEAIVKREGLETAVLTTNRFYSDGGLMEIIQEASSATCKFALDYYTEQVSINRVIREFESVHTDEDDEIDAVNLKQAFESVAFATGANPPAIILALLREAAEWLRGGYNNLGEEREADNEDGEDICADCGGLIHDDIVYESEPTTPILVATY